MVETRPQRSWSGDGQAKPREHPDNEAAHDEVREIHDEQEGR